MTADSMRDHLIISKVNTDISRTGEIIEDEIKKFYFIEAMYYANKAASQLFYFKGQGAHAIQTDSSAGGVPHIRFQNVSEIISKIYDDLIKYAKDEEEYKELLEDNSDELKNFNDLMHYMSIKAPELAGLDDLQVTITSEGEKKEHNN